MRSKDRSRWRTIVIVSLAGLGFAASAAAVDVRGSLKIPDGWLSEPPVLEAPLKPYWEEWNGILDLRPRGPDPSRRIAAVLTGESTEAPVGCVYTFQGGSLAPDTLVAKTGTTLRIENRDGCAHELYADGLDELAPMQTAPGNARTATIGKAGSWPLRDRYYPHVTGHLHVLPDLVACAELDDQGRYRFSDVPSGTYTLKIFVGDKEVASHPVEIPDGRPHTLDAIELSAPSK